MKYSKAEVDFEHPGKGKDKCGQCKHYEVHGPETCGIVAGHIESGDWCNKFVRGHAMAKAFTKAKH